MSEIADAVHPVSSVAEEDCWKKRRMFNSYKRLNMAYKLNQWDNPDGMTNPAENTKTAASPSQHKDDPKDQDDQTAQVPVKDKATSPSIPVEPMTSHPPPTLMQPTPSTSSLLPPDLPANFSAKLNKVAKMKTGPICFKAKLVQAMATKPRVILQRLPIEDIEIHSATI